MPFTIHEEPRPARLVTMGQADRIIEPEPLIIQDFKTADEFLVAYNEAAEKAMAAAAPIPDDPPLEPVKANRGRKKMAKEKDLEEVGTKTIRQDDAGEQGAIGSHGANAPAQEKVPASDEDKEAQANG